jgi:hypothetical protein
MPIKFGKPFTIYGRELKKREGFPQIVHQANTQVIFAINNRIIHPYPAPAIIHQAGILQVGKMAGDGGLGKLEYIHNIANTQLSFQEEKKDTETGFVW